MMAAYNYTNNDTGCFNSSDCHDGVSWCDISIGTCVPMVIDYLSWNDPVAWLFFLVAMFHAIMVSIIMGVFVAKRNTPLVKASNKHLSFLLLGLLFTSSFLPFFHIGYPNSLRCTVHMCAQGPSYTLGVSVLLVKTHHIKKVFEAKLPRINYSARRQRRRRNWGRSESAQIVCVLALFSLQVVGIIIFLVTQFPVTILVIDAHHHPVHDPVPIAFVQCEYGYWTYVAMNTYNLILVLMCFTLSFKARHIPNNFCESRHISAAMATNLIILILCMVGMFFSLGRMRAIYQAILVLTVPFLQTLFLFIPKCTIIVCYPARNTVNEVRRTTLTHADWKTRCAIVSRNTLHQLAKERDGNPMNKCGGQNNEALEVGGVITDPIPPR